MRKTMDAAPTRSMVIGGGDINKQLGKDKNGNSTGNGVGEYGGFTKGAQTKNGMTGLTMEHSHAWIRFITLVVLISQPKETDPSLTTFLLSKALRNDSTYASHTAVPEGCNSSLTSTRETMCQ